MNNKLEILLVEDDTDICMEISELANASDDLTITGITNNSGEALTFIKNNMPDAVILDLELHDGSGSGLDLLYNMKNTSLSKIPYVLVTTNNSSPVTYESVRNLGADFIMSKHQENYSSKNVLDFLRIIRGSIQTKNDHADMLEATTESPEQYAKRIRRYIMTELDYVGINQKSVGYKYLIDAILLCDKETTQDICHILGEKYGKTNTSIERAMQNAINRAWRTCSIEDLLEHYTAKINVDRGNPTITEFICYYSNKIKNEY